MSSHLDFENLKIIVTTMVERLLPEIPDANGRWTDTNQCSEREQLFLDEICEQTPEVIDSFTLEEENLDDEEICSTPLRLTIDNIRIAYYYPIKTFCIRETHKWPDDDYEAGNFESHVDLNTGSLNLK